jgi:hypothetical protein
MSVLNENQLLGSSGAGGDYNLENSLRFRSSASAYLNRTPATAGNRKTWTWSGWVKRGKLGQYTFFAAGSADTSRTLLFFDASDRLNLVNTVAPNYYGTVTTAVFRDPSAWYHIVFSVNTTQATTANRVKIYVNGVQQTSTTAYSLGYLALNVNTFVNFTNAHTLGSNPSYNVTNYFDGYLTEVNFVDGQALTADDFGDTNENTGVWQPKKYTGTYGTNGFYLPMNKTVETYDATYLLVAGGGGGAGYTGGGGAGGLLSGTNQMIPGDTYSFVVGAGGAAVGGGAGGNNGANTTGLGLTAIGGGRGNSGIGGSGGGGGGGTGPIAGGAGTPGQGFAGGAFSQSGGSSLARWGGGGGGASEVGFASVSGAGGAGGDGLASSITGSSVIYAGGGGGGYDGRAGGVGGAGGAGGGGNGVAGGATAGSGTPNTGSGGGGAGYTAGYGTSGAGGSGVVILRVPTAKYTGTVTGSPIVTTTGSDTVIQFNANGSYTA